MAERYVETNEWYPVRELRRKEEIPPDCGARIELTDDELAWVESAFARFEEVQAFLKKKEGR